jgi:hypothetical protein
MVATFDKGGIASDTQSALDKLNLSGLFFPSHCGWQTLAGGTTWDLYNQIIAG